MSTTPEDILIYIDGLKNPDETGTSDTQTLIDCYHAYKDQVIRTSQGETSDGGQKMKNLISNEKRLIVELHNAIRDQTFMGRKFILCPLNEANRQRCGNIDYWDFVSDIVREESGIYPPTKSEEETK